MLTIIGNGNRYGPPRRPVRRSLTQTLYREKKKSHSVDSRVASSKGPGPTAFLFGTRVECVAVVAALDTKQDT